ncbi:hypothetical protein [Roseivivax sp. CAU 1753]
MSRLDFLPFRYIDEMVRAPGLFLAGSLSISQKAAMGVADGISTWRPDALRVLLEQTGPRFRSLVKFPYEHVGTIAVWQTTADRLKVMDADSLWATYLSVGKGFVRADGDEVMLLLRNLVGGADINQLDAGHMRALYGRARRSGATEMPWITIPDLVQGMARTAEIFAHEAYEIGGTLGGPALKAKLFQVDGLATAAGTFLMRSGYDFGTRLEVRVVAVLLEIGQEVAHLRVSFPMFDKALGPDVAIYKAAGEAGQWLVSFVQCKALKDFGALVSPVASSESLRQIFSDARRVGARGWRGAGPGEGSDGMSALFDGGYSFAFDFAHFLQNADSPLVSITNQMKRIDPDFAFDMSADAADILVQAKSAMRHVMDARAQQLADAVNILRPGSSIAFTDAIRDELVNVIHNQIFRKIDGPKPPRWDWDEITPLMLLGNGIIGPSEFQRFEDLFAQGTGPFLIAATQASLGFTDDILAEMPVFRVTMVLVEDGGSWLGSLLGTAGSALRQWLPGGAN